MTHFDDLSYLIRFRHTCTKKTEVYANGDFFQENQRDLMVSFSSFNEKSYTSVFMYDKTVVAVVADLWSYFSTRLLILIL